MECNRDEALRSKSIAEKKLENKDFAGAKKFAMKAQTLYPGLDGISPILTILDVYISAENKISGETDWYGVLGVSPSDDDEAIKKQYRKLALMLHPDKNKAVGADGAFKLISEAWSLLSDKAKRLQYNQRRGSRGFQQKVQMHAGSNTGGPSTAAPRGDGIFNFASRMSSVPKTQNNTAKPPPPKPTPTPKPTPSSQRHDTFWTICHRCKMHYEYLKVYLNHTLLCPNCREAFMASETAPPFSNSKTSGQIPRQRHNTPSVRPSRPAYDSGKNVPVATQSGAAASNSFRHPQYKQNPVSATAGAAKTDPSIAAKAANVVQLAQDKLKRSYTEWHASAGSERTQKRKLDDDNSRYGVNYNVAQGNGGLGTARGSAPGSRFYGFSGTYRQPNRTSDLTPMETRKMLSVKARMEILNKLDSWRSETKESKKDGHRSTGKIQRRDQNGNDDFTATKLAGQPANVQKGISDDNPSKEEPEGASMNVPDPDFHDFDQDRTESSFGDNEVWSAYDDDDGMPRFYALISKVISRNPFKLKMSWLNSKTNSEFSTMDWVGSGFYKTCGEFRVGRYESCKSINAFSQKVNWSKGPRGTIFIVPQKGDVWALYKNWSSNWNEQTPDDVVHKYDMVTVLDNYSEDQGVRIAPLVKVVGFKTVFRPNMDPEAIKSISKEEMFRFSHRVPNHLLTGVEAPNAPKGCLELDPAATPLELLQVTANDDEVPMVPDGVKAAEEVLKNVPNSSPLRPSMEINGSLPS